MLHLRDQVKYMMPVRAKQSISGLLFLIFFGLVCVRSSYGRDSSPGGELYSQGRYRESLSWYIGEFGESPQNARVLYNLGNISYQLGAYQRARKYWHDALRRDAVLKSAAFYNIGNGFYRERRLKEAVIYYRKAVHENPGDIDARANLKRALFELRKQAEKTGKASRPARGSEKGKVDRDIRARTKKPSPGDMKHAKPPKGKESTTRQIVSRGLSKGDIPVQGKDLSAQEIEFLLNSVKEGKRNPIMSLDSPSSTAKVQQKDW